MNQQTNKQTDMVYTLLRLTKKFTHIHLTAFNSLDEAVIKTLQHGFENYTIHNLNSYDNKEDSLRCDNVDGELIIYNESDREICKVCFKVEEFDNRNEEFFDNTYGYELGVIEIHEMDISTSRLSADLKKEIEHQAQNIIDTLNNDLHS